MIGLGLVYLKPIKSEKKSILTAVHNESAERHKY